MCGEGEEGVRERVRGGGEAESGGDGGGVWVGEGGGGGGWVGGRV